MRRDPNLVLLSHQHHNGLALCVLTRRSLAADASPENIDVLARRAVDRYELELANHFELEEQILFPAISSAIGEAALITELVTQHREIERLIAQLRTAPTSALLERLCALLTAHIRREENELFQMAQQRLPTATLASLGAAIEEKVVRICIS